MDNNIVKSNIKFPTVDNRFIPSKKLKYPINDLSLHENPILEKDLIDDKVGILDIRATLNQTIPCDVEMQIASSKHIAERILWYWAKLYCSQISRGEQYGKLHKTIAILFAVEPISNTSPFLDNFRNEG